MLKMFSENAVSLIKEFEGCYLEAYYDSVGVITIGYGITNADRDITGMTIVKGMKITSEIAEKWLRNSLLKSYLPKVLKYDKKYNWNQNELDSLLSFCYNIGSIKELTKNGTRTKEQIAESMLLYVNAGGKPLKGLARRRKAERNLFMKEVKKKEGCFTINKKANNINEFLHNRGFSAGENNLRLIASQNWDNLKKAMFELACTGDLKKPDGLNKRKGE